LPLAGRASRGSAGRPVSWSRRVELLAAAGCLASLVSMVASPEFAWNVCEDRGSSCPRRSHDRRHDGGELGRRDRGAVAAIVVARSGASKARTSAGWGGGDANQHFVAIAQAPSTIATFFPYIQHFVAHPARAAAIETKRWLPAALPSGG
jgi:hypothetical protein